MFWFSFGRLYIVTIHIENTLCYNEYTHNAGWVIKRREGRRYVWCDFKESLLKEGTVAQMRPWQRTLSGGLGRLERVQRKESKRKGKLLDQSMTALQTLPASLAIATLAREYGILVLGQQSQCAFAEPANSTNVHHGYSKSHWQWTINLAPLLA